MEIQSIGGTMLTAMWTHGGKEQRTSWLSLGILKQNDALSDIGEP